MRQCALQHRTAATHHFASPRDAGWTLSCMSATCFCVCVRLLFFSVKRRRPKAFAEPLAAQGFCQGWIGAAARDRWLHASLTQELFLGGGESGRQPRPSWDGSSGVPSRIPSLQRTRDWSRGGPVVIQWYVR